MIGMNCAPGVQSVSRTGERGTSGYTRGPLLRRSLFLSVSRESVTVTNSGFVIFFFLFFFFFSEQEEQEQYTCGRSHLSRACDVGLDTREVSGIKDGASPGAVEWWAWTGLGGGGWW